MTRQELELMQRFERDSHWFHENIQVLRKDFTWKIVAVKEGKVIASGKNMEEVMVILTEKKEKPELIFMEVVYPEGYTLLL
ncbi:hypothetical protein A3K73_00345 [Candidatus Pacearchaeota archaeon RBG_13_36_9]|nr:MAG: hypothetical protein A3K73_00345 [Candidatus Pacearchaeota archaeon RBG_13_36_9]HJX50308.1 hypothetical protein [Candidatus Nanoarchaeia archaeon]